MINRKLTFTIFFISIILGISLTNSVSAYEYDQSYGDHKMTGEEILSLVKNNEEVVSWLDNHTLEYENIWGWDGYWTVQLSTYNQTDVYYLEVIVNDLTQEIISISYYLDEYRSWELQELILQNARNYLSQPEFDSYFDDVIQNSEMWLTGNSKIQFNTWEYNDMFGELGYTHSLNGSINFQLIMIRSTTSFGNVSLSYDEAITIAENTTIFKNFNSNYSSYNINSEVYQYLYFDTPYAHFPPGYLFKIEYGGWTGDGILEYIDGTFIETINYDYNNENNYIWFDNYKRIKIFINGSDGTILQMNKNYLESYAYYANLALEQPEVSEIVSEMLKFYGDFYHQYGDIYRLSIYSEFSPAWVNVEINVTSEETLLIESFKPIPATRTESDIVGTAFANNEIQELMQNTLEFDYSVLYDFKGMWRLEFFDKILVDASGYVEIDDVTGEIVYSSSWYGELPNLEISEVIQIALDTDLRGFNRNHPNARISMFFDWDRRWQIVVYDPIYVDSYIRITVSDNNGDTELVNDFSNVYSTTNDLDSIRTHLQTRDEYKEFVNLVGEKYEYIYYQDGWRVYLENIDPDNVRTQVYLTLRDSSLALTDYYTYDDWMNWNYQRIWPEEISDMFEYQWGFERLDKILYTLLGDVIVEYTPTTPLSDESTESLDLPAFTLGLSISILFLTTVIIKKSKRLKL